VARKTKTWAEKMQTGAPQITRLDKPFAGVPAGATLLISSPKEVDAYLKTHVRPGTSCTVPELRYALAQAHRADATCPMTSSIFVRIVAENAWDELEAGAKITDVAPFWRVVEPNSPLAKKLRAGSEWIARQRAAEQKPAKPR
jgi:hypothetical protein